MQFQIKETEEQINQVEKEISSIVAEGLVTVDADRLLTQAKKYFESKDFANAKQYTLNTRQLIKDLKDKQKGSVARETFAYVKQLYKEVKSMGGNIIQADAPLMQAEASLTNKDYDMALNYAQDSRQILRGIRKPFLVKLTQKAMGNAKKIIYDAHNYGANVTEAQKLYEEAQNALTKNDLDTAEEKAKKAEKLAVKAQQQYYDNYVSNEINTLKDNIVNLKNQSYDVTQAEELIGVVNTLYLEKDFQEIGKKLQELREHLIGLEGARYIERAVDAISFSKSMVKYIKDNINGISSRLKEPEKFIKNAEVQFKNKKYLQAEQFALETQRAIENIKHSKLDQFLFVFRQLQAEEMLGKAKDIIVNIKKFGIEFQDMEELINKAEAAFKDDATYNDAKGFLTEVKILANEKENTFHEKNAANAISAAESLILTLKQQGFNVETANKFLDQAKTALEIREFKKSILFAGKAKFTAKKLQDNAK
jgi:hypothetical protein